LHSYFPKSPIFGRFIHLATCRTFKTGFQGRSRPQNHHELTKSTAYTEVSVSEPIDTNHNLLQTNHLHAPAKWTFALVLSARRFDEMKQRSKTCF
jgi:hypothetical protein